MAKSHNSRKRHKNAGSKLHQQQSLLHACEGLTHENRQDHAAKDAAMEPLCCGGQSASTSTQQCNKLAAGAKMLDSDCCRNDDEALTNGHAYAFSLSTSYSLGKSEVACHNGNFIPHDSSQNNWWKWLDEPEYMVPENSFIRKSSSSDGVLSEISASVVCHQTADSLFSTTSEFTNYRGILNWCFMLLTLSLGKTTLENIIRYGVLIDPVAWLSAILHRPLECPSFLLFLGVNVFILIALRLEKLSWQATLPEAISRCLHIMNLLLLITVPACFVLYLHPNPVASSMSLGIYVLVFLKLISFIQVNSWCRQYTALSSSCRAKLFVDDHTWDLIKNLVFAKLYYFICAPTLCYDFNFPRSPRIRKRFLLKRVLEVIFLPALILSLIQQWIVPIVDQSHTSFRQKDISGIIHSLLHVTLPNHFIWLVSFYWFFHSVLNVTAELLRFGDRVFYRDWWNAESVQYFWQNWNIPVHKWALRHMYRPMRKRGCSKNVANVAVFLASAFFHEYLVSVPLRMFRLWAFTGMLGQVPLSWITSRYATGKLGNMIVWTTVIILQPIGILMYYHDYYVINSL